LGTTTNVEGDDELAKLISVSLRPNDPFAKRLLSTPVTTNNLLLKVTVPKRTGRKRKRGTTGPFLAESELQEATNGSHQSSTVSVSHSYVEASDIYRSLQDNASRYEVAFAGVVDETHRFRGKHTLTFNANKSLTITHSHAGSAVRCITQRRDGWAEGSYPSSTMSAELFHVPKTRLADHSQMAT
jgi:general transcription factor 3C polypeptide 5 (transcription factor C subunit 1)